MTIIRLESDQLWIHSPIPYTAEMAKQIAELGVVKYLIAPNHLHHLFLAEWQSHYPDAQTFATNELIKKKPDLAFNFSLNEDRVWPWSKEIDQVLFSGSPLMEECVFFHRSSETLLVTDLIENFPPDHFTGWQQLLARFTGIIAPNGKMPIDWRLSFMFRKSEARENFTNILHWQPDRIVMSHGLIIEENGTSFLKKSFRWLGTPD